MRKCFAYDYESSFTTCFFQEEVLASVTEEEACLFGADQSIG